jgi:hypothetical protein
MSLEEGTDTWHDEVEIPDDADERDAAGTNVALEALLDRTQFLFRSLFVAGHDLSLLDVLATSFGLTVPTAFPRQVPLTPIMASGAWSVETQALAGVPTLHRIYTTTTADEWLLLPLSSVLPYDSTLNSFTVKVGVDAAAPSLPVGADRMQAAIFRQQLINTSDTQLAIVGSAVNDPSDDLAAYKLKHFISFGSVNHVVASGYDYYLGVKSDSNGYAQLYQAAIAYTASVIRPGGA